MTGFHAFGEAVAARLDKGRREYGDRSFDRPTRELLAEIEEELLNVCGWSFVLSRRIRRLGSLAEEAERPEHDEQERAAVEDRLSQQKPPEIGLASYGADESSDVDHVAALPREREA